MRRRRHVCTRVTCLRRSSFIRRPRPAGAASPANRRVLDLAHDLSDLTDFLRRLGLGSEDVRFDDPELIGVAPEWARGVAVASPEHAPELPLPEDLPRLYTIRMLLLTLLRQ